MVDVLILNYNDYKTTLGLVHSIECYKNIAHILIVDNASTDGSYDMLKCFCNDKIDVVRTDRNGGYGYGNNFGIEYLSSKYSSKYTLLCNPDVIFDEYLIDVMEKFLNENSEYIIVAPFMYDKNKIKQSNTMCR